jgi:hypothetical protein
MNPNRLNRKAIVLVSSILAVLVCTGPSAGALAATNPVPLLSAVAPATGNPTAAELIDRLGATLDKLWTSFAATMESTSTFEAKLRERPEYRPGQWHRDVRTYEYRGDGERAYTLAAVLWIGLLSGANELKHPPGNHYFLWDGKAWYDYEYTAGLTTRDLGGRLGKEGTLMLTNARPQNPFMWLGTPTRPIVGSFIGVRGNERIDGELRQATTLSLAPRTDTINGSACYVLNASGGGSAYQVWIDPKHDYNVAKAIIRRNWTSYSRPESYKTPPAAGYQVMQLTVSSFQSVDGVWLAKEADFHHEERFANTDYLVSNKHIKIPKYARNPDHEALGSFKTTFIREGARVYFGPVRRGDKPENYVWRQGRPVLEQDKSR